MTAHRIGNHALILCPINLSLGGFIPMYKLANIICTTLCALSLNQAFSDDVGFIPEQEISLASPLDNHESLQAFSHAEQPFSEHSNSQDASLPLHETHSLTSANEHTAHARTIAKQVAVKPFTGKVKARKLRMRARADLDGAIIKDLGRGELVSVVAEKGDFWAVEPPANFKAYVFRSYILDNAVEGNNVNVRLKPNVDSPVLTHLNSGDKIKGSICAENNKWLEITLPSNTYFYVSKQFIENVGSPDVKVKHDLRKQAAFEAFETAQHVGKTELAKNFPEVDFDKVTHNFQVVMSEYSDFSELALSAREELSTLQEQYLDKRLSYVETKVPQEEELSAAAQSQLFAAVTDKMKLWEPIEESLYLSWSNINDSRSLDEYYSEQKLSAATVSGILEPYTAPVKSKPGDFIIRENDLPVAYVYSTQVNLQNLVGQKVKLIGAPRPNNNFAFPAYFILSAE